MKIVRGNLNKEIFKNIYNSIPGWESPSLDQIEIALSNSLETFLVYDEDIPVGMARLIGDKGMSFYIKDFAILPKYQSKGIGKLIESDIEKYILENIEPSWKVSLELISSKEAVSFYKRLGFEERPSSEDGPGMFKMI